jgi:hypothetical protein
MVKETVEGEWAMTARFGWRFAMVRVTSGGALASRSSSTASPCSPQAPPWVNCFERLSSCGDYLHVLGFGDCGIKFDGYGPLFIGLLGPTHRGDGVLRFLYTNQTLTRLCLGDFWKGMDSG